MRPRILMTADAVGGVWQYATELAHALIPLGYDVPLATIGPPPSESQRALANGLSLIETGLPADWLAEGEGPARIAARSLAALAESTGAALIHLNQPAFAAEAMPVPVVAVAHSCVASWWDAAGDGPLPGEYAWQRRLTAHGLLRADAVVAPSRAFAEATRRIYGLTALPRIVHNGRTPVDAPIGAIHDFVLTAGRLWDSGKNVAMLDRVAARLSVPVKAAGSVQHPAGGVASFDNLCLLGSISGAQLAELYAARPVFASPALYEPFGLAVLEAAQAGCALVLSDIPSFRELWDDAAIFLDPRDEAGWASTLQSLVGDVGMRIERGDAARAHAARYTPAAMASGMAGVYRDIIAGAPRVAA